MMCTRLAGLLTLLAVPALAAADPPPNGGRGWLDPRQYRDQGRAAVARLKQVEFVRMFSAVVGGSQMGPGDGWFGPSEGLYGWEWLARRHGIDPKKGSISRKDFKGPPELFERLDRNKDTVLQADDFDWSERSAFARAAMPSQFWFRSMDTNSNGRISKEEWAAYFEKLSKGKGYLTQDDLREGLPVMPPPRPPGPPPKNEGPSPVTLVLGLLSGELGSPFPGPAVGQEAPDFTLPTQDGGEKITLSQYRGNKPAVLIFGSFT